MILGLQREVRDLAKMPRSISDLAAHRFGYFPRNGPRSCQPSIAQLKSPQTETKMKLFFLGPHSGLKKNQHPGTPAVHQRSKSLRKSLRTPTTHIVSQDVGILDS